MAELTEDQNRIHYHVVMALRHLTAIGMNKVELGTLLSGFTATVIGNQEKMLEIYQELNHWEGQQDYMQQEAEQAVDEQSESEQQILENQ